MTTTGIDVGPEVLAASDEIAARLACPATVLPNGYQGPARRWPQSLAGGATGIAILHIERARTGHASWVPARAWLAEAASGRITAASNAGLFFGAPALAFVVRLAAAPAGSCRRALTALDDATASITHTEITSAHARMNRGERPKLREFDLVRGLAGLGAYHLHAHPDHEVTRRVLSCLTRLTEPLPGAKDGLPPWWTGTAPTGEPSREFPGGHGNLGMSHGIASALAVLSIAIMRSITVPGIEDAARRICAWTDRWQPGDDSAPWWPGIITTSQHQAGHIDPALRPRPSWCYGTAGTARAQQLAGLALGDPGRQHAAEAAILAVLRDPAELGRLTEPGLCHGTAGLLQAAWRIAADSPRNEIAAELPRVAAHLTAQLTGDHISNPELLGGAAGAGLALHTVGTGCSPEPGWDAFLALA
jgi:hypothetical protein